MKIEQILLTFDETYKECRAANGVSIFEYIFSIFGITNEKDCTALSLAAAKLKQMLKTNEDTPVYEPAELLSDVTTMLYSLITKLHVAGISNALSYILEFEDPVTLQDAKQAMLRLQETTSTELLAVYKEVFDVGQVLDYAPAIVFDDSDFTCYEGILGNAADKDGYNALGICYTTSWDDVHAIAKDIIKTPGTLLPLVAKRGANNPFAKIAESSKAIKSNCIAANIPIYSA